MDVIAEIVKNLLVIIIMSSFLELMLPDGNIKPFVRFAIGLFILIAVLSPTLAYIYDDKNFQISVWDDRIDEHISQEIQASGKKIQQQITGKSSELMKEKLEGQISAVAILVPGVDDVHTQVSVGEDGSLQRLQLMVRPGKNKSTEEVEKVNAFSGSPQSDNEQTEIQRKILQVMGNLYGLKGENIEIKFEGG
ncbi:MAG: stage III sporulation protein AF [Syntrophomonas sp.]|nr:stage III sporulation protein AF [Syntrophomonas sp.]